MSDGRDPVPPGGTGRPVAARPVQVAFIGLGDIGGPMADRVIAAGHDVTVVDLDPERVAPRLAAGARTAPSAAEAARRAEVVCVVVFDDAQAKAVVAGPDGVLDTAAPGTVVLLHTTASLDTIDELGAACDERAVAFLDAGISGGSHGAAKGALVVMVGGPAEALERARPVVDAYSDDVIHAGPRGTGMALKLARNAAGYLLMNAAHEALALTAAAGVDPKALAHVLQKPTMLQQLLAPTMMGGPAPLPEDAPAPFRAAMEHTLALAEKDLAGALDLAGRLGVDVPAIALGRTTFHRTVRLPRAR